MINIRKLLGGKSAADYKAEHLASLELDRVKRVARFARGNVRLQNTARSRKSSTSNDNHHERAELIERLKRDLSPDST